MITMDASRDYILLSSNPETNGKCVQIVSQDEEQAQVMLPNGNIIICDTMMLIEAGIGRFTKK
jgi:hypothetical protein